MGWIPSSHRLVKQGEILKLDDNPDSKVHGANMGPNWGRQDPGGLHVGPMNFAIWEMFLGTRGPFLE